MRIMYRTQGGYFSIIQMKCRSINELFAAGSFNIEIDSPDCHNYDPI